MVSHNPQYWCLDQYNLICYGDANDLIFKNSAGRSVFERDRMFEFTDLTVKEHYEQDISKLATLPTVVVAELASYYYLRRPVPARFTRISNVQLQAGNSKVSFEYQHLDDAILSEDMFNSDLFRMHGERRERNRTHWAVKTGNLTEWMIIQWKERAALAKPRFFEVPEWPLSKLHDIAIMMPFSAEFCNVYKAIIAACDSVQATHIRVDEIYKPSKVADDIFAAIARSRLVICDLTGKNPNVLYETGLAHALNAEVIMLTQNGDDVPFDLRHFRFFTYLNNGEGLQKLQANLERIIHECLAK